MNTIEIGKTKSKRDWFRWKKNMIKISHLIRTT